MGSHKRVRAKAIRAVENARESAREELSREEFDELGFSENLGREFDASPASFGHKYRQYLEGLSSEEMSAILGPDVP